ncbi:MAG: Rab family GTPase [Promethearchaeota archaeon]
MERYTFKIIVAGDYAVGKTSLLNRYIDARFSEDYLPTLGVNMLRREMQRGENKIKLLFWDIAGQELFAQVREQFYEGTQGAMLVYDVNRPETFANISKWHNEIIKRNEETVHCILIGNKIDLEKIVPTGEGKKYAEEHKMFFFETSARTGKRIDEAFNYFTEYLINIY